MTRSYRLLCPIARALDRLGDRWTLLIVRDLHAGPMRFGEILDGLPGLATNLLKTRLDQLQEDGLVRREGPLYALTDAGRRTDAVLWELAQLGMTYPPDPEPKPPGHLRLAAITLQNALARVAPPDARVTAELRLDGEPLSVIVGDGEARVRYGAPDAPDVVARTSYGPLMAAAAGELPLGTFRAEHVTLDGSPAAVETLQTLMSKVMLDAFAATP